MIPFGPWEPDSAGVDSGKLIEAKNVYSSPTGYKPIPSLESYGAPALPADCKGFTYAKTIAGGWLIFAGTATALYKYSGGAWVVYTRLAGGAYAVPTDEEWSFTQFGPHLIAVNFVDDPQTINVDSGAVNFSALAGSPPKARYVDVVGEFVVLAALATNPLKARNSALNSTTGWTVGVGLCDEQEFPDGGRITGLKGGEFGYLAQETAIRRMIFQPGQDFAFRFERVEQEHGCASLYGLASSGSRIFFPAQDGFYMFGGDGLVPIGAQRINTWFRENSDSARFFAIHAFTDPYAPRIYWAFHNNSSSVTFDRLLIYDWMLDRWSWADPAAEMWSSIATPGLTLEDLDAFGSVDTGVPYSLDSRVWAGGRPTIGAIKSNGMLAFLEGSAPLTAVITPCEMNMAGGKRGMISGGVFPIGVFNDATLGVRVGRREHTNQAQTFTGSVSPSTLTGWARMRASGRIHQPEFTITQATGTRWKHFQGFEVDITASGMR